jgi:hypothetical protein
MSQRLNPTFDILVSSDLTINWYLALTWLEKGKGEEAKTIIQEGLD